MTLLAHALTKGTNAPAGLNSEPLELRVEEEGACPRPHEAGLLGNNW